MRGFDSHPNHMDEEKRLKEILEELRLMRNRYEQNSEERLVYNAVCAKLDYLLTIVPVNEYKSHYEELVDKLDKEGKIQTFEIPMEFDNTPIASLNIDDDI